MTTDEYILDKIGKRIVCLRTDATYGIVKDEAYRIESVESKNGKEFYQIQTPKFPDLIGFRATSGTFMTIRDSIIRLRELKLQRVFARWKRNKP